MDCPSSVRLANALSFLAATNQQHVLRYLSLLEARNYASSTLLVVAGALKSLTRHLPDTRQAALIADLTQTTSQDISDFVCAAQKAGLAPRVRADRQEWVNSRLNLRRYNFEIGGKDR